MLLITLLLVALFGGADGFTFLGKVKMPQMPSFEKMKSDQKFGNKKIAIITGTSSGLGRQTAKHLLKTGRWHVIGACRDLDKMAQVAEEGKQLSNINPP